MIDRLHRLALAAALSACGGAQQPGAPPPHEPVRFGSLEHAIAGPHRTEAERARDRYRHPRETLTFFGVEPRSRVVELWPGGGWYTAILAPLVREDGHLRAVVPAGPFAERFRAFLAARPDVYDRVDPIEIAPADGAELSFGEDASADVVLTFRNYHNWMSGSYEDEILAAAFRVLRPGGVLGVVEHRADPDADRATMVRTGYVSEQTMIDAAQAAGFVLEERAEVNANPDDDHDHPHGVWSLPPALRGGDADREVFLAIGESDRATLRFRKPQGE